MLKNFKRLLPPQQWLLNVLLCLAIVAPNFSQRPVYANPLDAPSVQYISASNTIIVGSASGVPNGSQAITLPELAAALGAQGFTALLLDQGNGSWLLKANVLLNPTAQLVVTSATIKELRLESILGNFINITAQRGGYLLIDGIKLTSWDSAGNTVDQNTTDGRSYLIAQEGGRMDISNSEVAYLGWGANEVSGLIWRKRLNPVEPTTGATGTVQNNDIHDNYYGLFAAGAYGLQVAGNQVHNNLGYGIAVRDSAENLKVAGNNIYANGDNGIVLGRLAQNNQVQDNQVHDHALDGIALEQGATNNLISANIAFNNRTGIALSQSSTNQVQNNNLHNNATGIRVEAKFNPNALADNLATNNQIVTNTIDSNTDYGIYLYSRADRNTLAGNTITKSGINGIYIKSGGNVLRANTVSSNATGIAILSDPDTLPAGAILPLDPSGQNNVIVASTITANTDSGIRIMGGVSNRIGANGQAPLPQDGNVIEGNAKDGVAIINATTGTASTDNVVLYNTIRNNGARGIYVNGAATARNRLSHNTITGNLSLGIKVDGGAQQGIQPPVITGVLLDGHVNGAASANATIEVYVDPAGEGQDFLGTTVADGTGAWSFLLPSQQDQKRLTALAMDASGNTSAFSGSSGSTAGALYHLNNDEHGQKTIEVTGAGAEITLPELSSGLGVSNTNLLVNLGNGVWQLNVNLFIKDNVTLNVTKESGVNELRLRSEAGANAVNTPVSAASVLSQLSTDTTTSDAALDDIATAEVSGTLAYTSFVYLRTHGGTINLDGVKVYSWDPTANSFDQDINNGRAYIIAKYAASLNINNAELAYLGSADSDSQGVTWRDLNDAAAPTVLRARVTGTVLNSEFHHNYYGAYTSQASNMVFRGNQFHDNLRYGFTPRDFTHDLLAENNLAFSNASHGFFISRGCTNLVLRHNKAYSNLDPGASLAHGFVFDPGSANSQQAPNLDNGLDGNEAYGNEGYGLRLQNANNNQVKNNFFHENQQGISIEQASTENTIISNTLNSNTINGIVVNETADGNTLSNNTVNGNANNGIYLRSSNNTVNGNTVNGNTKAGIALLLATGVLALQNNQLISNTVSGNLDSGLDLRGATHTLIQGNLMDGNAMQGLYLTANVNQIGASQNTIVHNIIRLNKGFGIRANGATTVANTWSANQIYSNLGGGISLNQKANGDLQEPQLVKVVQRIVSGKTVLPGLTVEIFTDDGVQGQFFEGQTTAGNDGTFTFTLPDTTVWQAGKIMAIAIDSQGNASPFSTTGLAAPVVTVATPTPTPTTTPGPIGAAANQNYLPLIRR